MTADEWNAIRARLTSATPGPWFARENDLIGGWRVRIVDTPPSEGPGEVADFIREEDASFIAAAPADLAALLAEVEYLRGEREAVVAWLRGEPERLVSCDGHRHADGKPCFVLSPMPADELADCIERGEHRREEEP